MPGPKVFGGVQILAFSNTYELTLLFEIPLRCSLCASSVVMVLQTTVCENEMAWDNRERLQVDKKTLFSWPA